MADRTSAEIFGSIFRKLAETPTELLLDRWEFAQWLYAQAEAYDFMDYQMNADDALDAFGLWEEDEDEEDG